MKRGLQCAAHRHISPVPQEDHHIWPKEYGGPTVASNMARVCSNAHGDVHYFISLLLKYDGDVPNDLRQHFGWKIRRIAQRGYDQIVKHHDDVKLQDIKKVAVERLEAERD